MTTEKRARDLVKRLREKPSKYNRDLLNEAAATIEDLLEELPIPRCCDTCKYDHVELAEEPCFSCFRASNWEKEEAEQ